MLPCRSTCTCAFEGCHKTCPRWRAMQEQQHAETARKKEYLRQADEACRAVLSQCRRCGGYVFSAGSYCFLKSKAEQARPNLCLHCF